jgi:hypothetical protein
MKNQKTLVGPKIKFQINIKKRARLSFLED